MEVGTVLKLKAKLQERILMDIQDFERATGLLVSDVRLLNARRVGEEPPGTVGIQVEVYV